MPEQPTPTRRSLTSAEDWNQRYRDQDLVWSPDPNRFVAELAGPPTGSGRALDVGAGEGRNAMWLVDQGWDVTATDFSAAAIAKTQALAEVRLRDCSRLHTRVEDATELDEESAYDLVLFSYLQLPGAQFRRALSAGVRACAPGGRILVVMHARRNITEGFGGPQEPAVLHDPEEVAEILASAGTEVDYAQLRTREVNDDDGPHTALDTVVGAHVR